MRDTQGSMKPHDNVAAMDRTKNKILRDLVACLAALVLGAAAVPAAEPMHAPDLMPVKMQPAPNHPPVELVREGQPRAVIFVADPKYHVKPDPDPKKARLATPNVLKRVVDELCEAVRLSTGGTLPLVQEPPAASQPAIIIGDCEESRQAGIDAAEIPIEGFVVKTAANRVYLVGSTQPLPDGSNVWSSWANEGTAWAVADFLERFVGVRWYWPLEAGGRSIVESPSLVVPPTHYTDQPAFRIRTHHPADAFPGPPWQSTWFEPGGGQPPFPLPADTKKLDMGSLLSYLRAGTSWPYTVKCHTPSQLWKQGGKWLEANKKLFARKGDGSPNYSMLCYSAPETLDYILAGCEAAWDKKDNGVYPSWVTATCVAVSPPDMAVNCFCPACRAKILEGRAANVDASLLLTEFVEKVAKEVARRWPDKKVIYLPYWNYAQCPANLKFPPNVEVMFCNNVSQGMASMRAKGNIGRAYGNIMGWSKAIGGPIQTWEYSGATVGTTHAPMQYPDVVQTYYRDMRGKLVGSFINGGLVTEWSKTAPTMYVWMRVLWNPDIDVEATLDELCRRQFGPAGKTARALLALMADRWENAPWKGRLGEAGQMPHDIFLDTWPPDVVAEMVRLRDQARKELAADPAALARLNYWLWTFDAFVAEADGRNKKVEKKDATKKDRQAGREKK